uniref:Uncharacterized protein n=1 Tax=Glossina brevipalpis TaxID=37001 RepID=A0A1A9W024_9MUSC
MFLILQLLHSLHEDDRQQFFRGSQNLRKGSMALTVSNTASPSLNDFSQQSRSIAATVTQQNSHGSNSGEINEVISMSSLLTSETAANNNDLNTHEYVCNDDGGGGGGGGGDKAIVTTPLLPKSDLKHNNINAK